MVSAKINITQVQATKTSINPQRESASSNISPSDEQFSALHTDPRNPKESLYSNKCIIIGTIKSAIAIIAIIPQVLLITPRLDDTVLKASLIDAPTIGTKLLIAKRAVFIESESFPCAKTFFADNRKNNIDITKTLTEVKAVFIVLDIPLRLHPPIGLTIEMVRQDLTSGIRQTTKNPSTKVIASTEIAQLVVVLDIAPDIIPIVLIKGKKAFITLHNVLIYALVNSARPTQEWKIVIEKHRVEHSLKALFNAELERELQIEDKAQVTIISVNIETKLRATLSTPEKI